VNNETHCPIASDEARLDAWVAGDAPEVDRRELNAHLMSCAACRAETSRLKRERELFADRAAVPDDTARALWDKIEPQLEPLPAARPSRGAGWAGVLVAVAAGLMIMVRFGVGGLHIGGFSVAPAEAPFASAMTGNPVTAPGAALPVPSKDKNDGLAVDVSGGSKTMMVRELPTRQRWFFQTGERPKIFIENVAGEIRVHASTRDRVDISADHEDEDINADWKLELRASSKDELHVRVFCAALRCGDAPDLELGLDVPLGAEVEVKSVSGDVAFHGGDGKAVIYSVSGDVRVGQVRNLEVHATSSDVALDLASPVRAKVDTVSGDVEWSGACAKDCDVAVKTVSGDVSLGLDKHSAYTLKWHTVSGEAAQVEQRGPGHVSVETVSGDLKLEGR
jgi:hypothetical protein